MNEEFAEAGAPQLGGMGVSMVGPTLIVHGTRRAEAPSTCRSILRGEVALVPGLQRAGLRLRPRIAADAGRARRRRLRRSTARRSGPPARHHAELDVPARPHRPGCAEAPRHHATSSWTSQRPASPCGRWSTWPAAHGFNEVFFEDVRVPPRNLVGEENRGWYVGTTTLDFERSGIGSAVGTRKKVEDLHRAGASEHTRRPGTARSRRNPAVRNELVDRYIEASVAADAVLPRHQHAERGPHPEHEASMAKLFTTELIQRIARTAMKYGSASYGQIWDATSPYAPCEGRVRAHLRELGAARRSPAAPARSSATSSPSAASACRGAEEPIWRPVRSTASKCSSSARSSPRRSAARCCPISVPR